LSASRAAAALRKPLHAAADGFIFVLTRQLHEEDTIRCAHAERREEHEQREENDFPGHARRISKR
jgi:hypothetical protein